MTANLEGLPWPIASATSSSHVLRPGPLAAVALRTRGAGPGPDGCGNNTIEYPPEKCDDGNTVSGDGCSYPSCLPEVCGDGITNPDRPPGPAETCDDGNTAPNDGCDASCRLECGNGTLEGAETCDTSGESATCDDDCTAVACGDGKREPGGGRDVRAAGHAEVRRRLPEHRPSPDAGAAGLHQRAQRERARGDEGRGQEHGEVLQGAWRPARPPTSRRASAPTRTARWPGPRGRRTRPTLRSAPRRTRQTSPTPMRSPSSAGRGAPRSSRRRRSSAPIRSSSTRRATRQVRPVSPRCRSASSSWPRPGVRRRTRRRGPP